MGVVAEAHAGEIELAAPLDVDLPRAVDENVGNVRVAQEGLERPQPDHVVDDLAGHHELLFVIDEEAPLVRDLGDELDDARTELVLGHHNDRRRLDALQHVVVDNVGRHGTARTHDTRRGQILAWRALRHRQSRRRSLTVS